VSERRAATEPGAVLSVEALRTDDRAWDAFVATADHGAFPQLSAWAEANAAGGWLRRRLVGPGPSGPVGVQLLVHRLGRTGWGRAYGPRGPVAASLTSDSLAAFTALCRHAGRRTGEMRLTRVLIDPELEAGDSREADLRSLGWAPVPPFEINATRLIDLRQSEAALLADLRSKWRQYVAKAGREGVTVEDAGPAGLDAFEAIHAETALRVGFMPARARAVHDAFLARGGARLLLARDPDGVPVAGLLLVACGERIVELYGGMTAAGAERHANYLLKWEAMRRAREAGFATYDVWGVDVPGLAHFKSGFGGREVRYIGAWELVVDPVGRAIEELGGAARSGLHRLAARGRSG
jgi:lipid II:glycine glycyltransferase (peptidoglycan interpeptide bridge formation enzyme)